MTVRDMKLTKKDITTLSKKPQVTFFSLGRKTKIDGPPAGQHLKQNECRAAPLWSVVWVCGSFEAIRAKADWVYGE